MINRLVFIVTVFFLIVNFSAELNSQVNEDYLWKHVPIGGGGLISGCSIAAKGLDARVKIIGIEPKNADEWWPVEPKKSHTPSVSSAAPVVAAVGRKVELRCGGLWGRTNPSFLYKTITARDLN